MSLVDDLLWKEITDLDAVVEADLFQSSQALPFKFGEFKNTILVYLG